jgi:hypothetical protein
MSEYKERDHMFLDKDGNYYSKHVLAMTKEGLHDKSDIAAELAYRDHDIAKLRELCDEMAKELQSALTLYNCSMDSKALPKYEQFKEQE